MRAVVLDRYGPADVLRIDQVEVPVPAAGEVRVRVVAAGANAGDWHIMRGAPFPVRLVVGGIFRPKVGILGADVAGTVEAVGPGVTRFREGDEVFGDLSVSGYGAFAEYVCAPESVLASKPDSVSFAEAAAVPVAAVAALQALRAGGGVEPGHQVAVNGASGGVGTFAVQIAKARGAHVTGVCSTRNVELVRQIGADEVIDYTRDDFVAGGRRYDRIIDAAAFRSILDYRHALLPNGAYVLVGGAPRRTYQAMLLGPILSKKGVRRMRFFIVQPTLDDLEAVGKLVGAGRVRPVLDRSYALAEVPEAMRYLERGRARGKVTITVAEG